MLTAGVKNNPFTVYETCDVALEIVPECRLSTGNRIDVRFPNSWTVGNDPSFTKELQTDDEGKDDYVQVETALEEAEFTTRIFGADYLTGREPFRHGRNIELVLAKGEIHPGEPIAVRFRNTLASRIAEVEEIYIALNGKRISPFPEIITVPKEHYMLRLIVPSSAKPGEQFPIHIVSLDPYFNLSSTHHENIELTDDIGNTVGQNISFTGRATVRSSIADEGVYRFRIGETPSNPIKISETFNGPCWGDIHIHSRLSTDGIGRYPYKYARDVSCLDFAACADHELSLYEEAWELTKQHVRQESREGSFVAILAYEAAAGYPDGHHNIYFYSDDANAPPAGTYLKITTAWPGLRHGEAITIPHHTGIGWCSDRLEESSAVDFTTDDRGFRNSLEIYSQHGQSELYDPYHCLAYEINRAHNEGRRVNISLAGPYYARDAWEMGKRWGVIASSDDHYGQGGKPFQGIAAVYTPQLETGSILNSIDARSTYATTGERILIKFSIDSAQMGEVLTAGSGDELSIVAEVHGTSPIIRFEIFKYCFSKKKYELVKHCSPMKMDLSVELNDTFSDSCFYYVRLAQKDLVEHRRSMAWTSPIWVERR